MLKRTEMSRNYVLLYSIRTNLPRYLGFPISFMKCHPLFIFVPSRACK